MKGQEGQIAEQQLPQTTENRLRVLQVDEKELQRLQQSAALYMQVQDFLKPVFVDIPVLIREWAGYAMLPAYLLTVDLTRGVAYCKAIVRHMPRPLLIGTQIIDYKMPSFVYVSIPLGHVSLLYNFAPLQAVSEAQSSEYWQAQTDQQIKEVLRCQTEEQIAIARELLSIVDAMQNTQAVELFPDVSLDTMEPYYFRSKPKSFNTQEFRYESLNQKLTDQMIQNRMVLGFLRVRFYQDGVYWMPRRQRENVSYDQIAQAVRFSAAFNWELNLFYEEMATLYFSFLEFVQASSQIGGFLGQVIARLDAIVTELIQLQEKLHFQLVGSGFSPRFQINFKLVTQILRDIRMTFGEIWRGNMVQMVPCQIQEFLLCKLQVVPFMVMLCAIRAYFAHALEMKREVYELAVFHNIFQLHSQIIQAERVESLVQEIKTFFQAAVGVDNKYFGQTMTAQPPKLFESFVINLQMALEVRVSSLNFLGVEDVSATVQRNQTFIELLMFCLLSNQKFVAANLQLGNVFKCTGFTEIELANLIEGSDSPQRRMLQDCSIFDFVVEKCPIQFDFNYHDELKFFFQQMIAAQTSVQNKIIDLFAMEDFVTRFSNWKQYNQQFLFYQKMSQPTIEDQDAYVSSVEQLKSLHICNLEEHNFCIDFSEIMQVVGQFVSYNAILDEISGMELYCYFLRFDLSFVTQTLRKHFDSCVFSVLQQIQQVLFKAYDNISMEYRQIRDIIQLSVCSPQFYTIIESIMRYFGDNAIKHQFDMVFNGVCSNLHGFYHAFESFYRPGYLNNLITNEQLDRFNQPIYALARLASARRHFLQSSHFDQKEIESYILQTFQWLRGFAGKLHEYVVQLMGLDYIKQQEMVSNPVKFHEQNQLLSSNIEIPPLAVKGGSQQLLNTFLQSLIKVTKLRLNFTVDGQEDVYDAIKTNYVLKPGDGVRTLEFYTKYDYNNVPLGVQPPGLKLEKLFFEIKYLTNELIGVQKWLECWLGTLPDGGARLKGLLRQNAFPSLFCLNNAISPLYEIINGIEFLQTRHAAGVVGKLPDYPAISMLQTLERVSVSVQIVRDRSLKGDFPIYTCAYDFAVKQHQPQSQLEEHRLCVIGYANYQDYLIYAEDYVLKFAPLINYMFLLQSKHFCNAVNCKINALLGVSEVSLRDVGAAELLASFERDNQVFDLLLTIWYNEKINYDTTRMLRRCVSAVKSVIVEAAFEHVIDSAQGSLVISRNDLTGTFDSQDVQVDLNRIMLIVLLPHYTTDLINETLQQVSLVINNAGYVNHDQDQDCEDMFERRLLGHYARQQENQHSKWRYSKTTEQLARNLESLSLLVQMIVQILQRIPDVLYDLQLAYSNGAVFVLNNQYRKAVQGVLTLEQRIKVLDSMYEWSALCSVYFPKGVQVSVAELAVNDAFVGRVISLLDGLEAIYRQQISGERGGMTTVVPLNNGYLAPLSLLLPQTFRFKYASVSQLHNIFGLPSLQYEILTSFTNITVNKSNQLISIQSNDEFLLMEQPVDLPGQIAFVFDVILQHSGNQLNFNCMSAFDVLYVAVGRYIQLRQGHETIYLANITEEHQYQNLPAYFKQFEQFFSQYRFQEIKVAISTLIANYYQHLFKLSISGRIEKDDFKEVYFIINDLSVSAFLFKQKSDYWRQSVVIVLHEWQLIFQEAISIFLRKQNCQVQTRNVHFSYQYYDQKAARVLVTDSRNTFQIDVGRHWLGSANIFDANLRLSIAQMRIMTKVLRALAQNQTVILVGAHGKHYQNSEQNIVLVQASRMLFRRYIFVVVTQFTFADNLKKICVCLLAGYIVQVMGIEYLLEDQLLQLVALSNDLRNRAGAFPLMRYVKDLKAGADGQQTAEMSAIAINECSNLGYLLYYLPELHQIESSYQFQFTEAKQLSEKEIKLHYSFASKQESSQQKNAFEQYQTFYQPSIKAKAIVDSFSGAVLVDVEESSPIQQFTKASEQHGRAFYEIQTFLQSLNSFFVSINQYEIQQIYNRAKDKSDNFSVAIITLDYILRQVIQIQEEQEQKSQMAALIANVVASAFGLDKQNSSVLISQAKAFIMYIDAGVQHLQTQKEARNEPPTGANAAKHNFQKYYADYLQRNSNPQLVNSLQLYSTTYQLPLQCVFDTMVAAEYLKTKNPLLIVNIDQTYLNIFLSAFSVIKKAAARVVSTAFQLVQQLESLPPQKVLVVVQPGNAEELYNMMDQLLGLFLAYPVVQNCYGQSVYWNDDKNAPAFFIVLSVELYKEISTLDIMSVFSHRMILIPNIENSLGSKLSMISNLTLQVDKLDRTNLLQDGTERVQLKFVTNSQTALNLIAQYQAQMITNIKKQEQQVQVDRRCLALPNYLRVCFSVMFDIVQQIFNVGKSQQEVLLLRSLIDYFLLRYKCLYVKNYNVQNKFVDFASKDLEAILYSDMHRKQMLQKTIQRSDNHFQRFSGLHYVLSKLGSLEAKQQREAKAMAQEVEAGMFTLAQQMKTQAHCPDIQINGFSETLFKNTEAQLMKLTQGQNLKMQTAVQQVIFSSMNSAEADRTGYGLQGSLEFQLANEFIAQAYLHDSDVLASLGNVLAPIAVAFWNAGSLYYSLVSNAGKQQWYQSKKGMAKHLAEKYEQFVGLLRGWQLSAQNCFVGVGAAVLLNIQDSCANFNLDCVRQFTRLQHDHESLHKLQHKLLAEDIVSSYSAVFKAVSAVLPSFSHEPFAYINYSFRIVDNKESKLYQKFVSEIKFIPCQLGRGVFANVGRSYSRQGIEDFSRQLSDSSLQHLIKQLDRQKRLSQIQQQENTKQQEVVMYQKLSQTKASTQGGTASKKQSIIQSKNPYDSDDEGATDANEVEQLRRSEAHLEAFEESAQIQPNPEADQIIAKFVDPGKVPCDIVSDQMIHLDSQRLALAIVLAAGMLSPLTISVTGTRHSGKSVLLDIAKLMVRDLSDQVFLLVNDAASASNAFAVRNQLAKKYLLRRNDIFESNGSRDKVQYTQRPSQRKILKYYATLAYPCFHIHASDVGPGLISPQVIQLLQNHYIQLSTGEQEDTAVSVLNQYERNSGLMQISDTSFIIECTPESSMRSLASIELIMPPITEQFALEYIKLIYSGVSDAWARQFVSGVYMVQSSLNKSIQNSFDFFNELLHNQLLSISQQSFSSPQMVEKIAMYENMGLEVEDMIAISPVSNLLRQQNDQELATPNIHSYLAALRKMSIDQFELEAIQEKIVSLCLLNSLQQNAFAPKTRQQLQQKVFLQTPWSDSQMLLEHNFVLHPVWEAYIINEALQNARRSTVQQQLQLQDSFTLNVQRLQQIVIPKASGSVLFSLPQLQFKELAFATNNFMCNSYIYYHFMEIFRIRGNQHNPLLFTKLIEVFYYQALQQAKNRLNLGAKMHFGISNLNSHQLTGIQGENDAITTYNYIFQQINQFASVVQNEFGKNSDVLEFFLQEKQRLQSIDASFCVRSASSRVRGFPLMTALQLKPIKQYVFLEHCTAAFYMGFLRELQEITGGYLASLNLVPKNAEAKKPQKEKTEKIKYRIFETEDIQQLLQQSSFRSIATQFDSQEDVIVDVRSIYQVMLSNQLPNLPHDSVDARLLSHLCKVRGVFGAIRFDQLNIILLLAIFRYSVLLALGIDPDAFAFVRQNDNSTMNREVGVPVQSRFSTSYPNKVVDQGRLANMLPISICNMQQIKDMINAASERPIAHLNSLTTQSMINLQTALAKDQIEEEKIEQLIRESRSVLLAIPWSLASMRTARGVSIWQLLSRMVEPLNGMPTIFDHEELLVICHLLAIKYKIVSTIFPGQLSIMLNQSFKLMIIGDQPVFLSSVALSKVQNLGTVQLPINGLINNYKARYQELLQTSSMQAQQSRQRQSDSLVKQFAGAHISQQSQFQNYLKQKQQMSKNNVIFSTIRDLLPLMKMSGCHIPKDNKIFQYLQLDQYFYKQQYALVLLAVYQQLASLSASSCVSLIKFSQLAAVFCDQIIDKLELFFNQYTLIASLLKFYQQLSEPLKTPVKQVDARLISTAYIVNVVTNQLNNQLNMLKQKGQSMPTQKQINLQTAAGECVYVRNFFYTVLETLREEFPKRLLIAQNAHFDAICAAAALCFGVNEKADKQLMHNKLFSGSYGDVSSDILEHMKQHNGDDELLNVTLQCVIQNLGIQCEIRCGSEAVKYQSNIEFADNGQVSSKLSSDSFTLASQTQNAGVYKFPFQIVEILTPKWPTAAVAQYFKLQQTLGEQCLSLIHATLLAYTGGSRIFFTENDICVASAVCIGALEANEMDSGTSEHQNAEKSPIDDKESAGVKLVVNTKQQLFTIECQGSKLEESVATVCAALQKPESVIVFSNCGTNLSQEHNVQLLANLLHLAVRNSIAAKSTFSFYGVEFQAARDIQNVPIVIGYEPQTLTIDQFLSQRNLCSQICVDKMAFMMPSSKLQSDLDKHVALRARAEKQQVIEQRMVIAVFGKDYCAHTLANGSRNCEMAINLQMTQAQRILEQFIKSVILAQILSDTELAQVKVDHHILQKMQQLTSTGDMMNTTLLQTSYLVSQNAQIKDFYDAIMEVYKLIVQNLGQRTAFQAGADIKQDVVSQHQLQNLQMFVVNNEGMRIAREVSQAISLSLALFYETRKYHLPSQIFTEEDNLNQIFFLLASDIAEYKQTLVGKYKDAPRENPAKVKNPKFLVDEQPLLYDVRHDSLSLKKRIISCILPYLNREIFIIFPSAYANAIWLLNSFLFLAQCQLICQTPQELESIARVFCSNQTDSVRLTTSYHLSQIFNPTSSFNVAKLYTDRQLKALTCIDSVKKIIPEICNISSQLQYAWLMLNIIARYSEQMCQSMPWFITNHASLVTFCQSKNPFLSLICFYLSREQRVFQDMEAEQTENCGVEIDWFNQLIKTYQKQKNQIIDVPPNFRAPSAQVFFLGFCIATALNPQTIFENIDIFAFSMRNIFKYSPEQLKKEVAAGSGIVKQGRLCELSAKDCARFISNSLENLLYLCGVASSANAAAVLSKPLLQLYNAVRNAFEKANFAADQAGALSINVVYYDQCYAIDEMLVYVSKTINQDEIQHACFQQIQNFSLQAARQHVSILSVSPNMNGHVAINQIVNCVKTTQQSLEQTAYYPLFILLPQSQFAQSLSGYSSDGTTRQDDTQTQLFAAAFEALQRASPISYVYIKQPESLEEAFKHYFCTAAQTVFLNAGEAKITARRINNIITLRGLSFLLLKMSLIAVRQQIALKDSWLISLLHTVINKTLHQDNLPVDVRATPFLARGFADLQLFVDEGDGGAGGPEQRLFLQYNEALKAALFQERLWERESGSGEFGHQEQRGQLLNPLENVIPPVLLEMFPRPRGIDEKIRQQMNVQLESDAESQNASDNASQSSMAVSVASSKRSQVSEISDDEGDFDDSMSMFSQKSSTTQRSQVSQLSQVSQISGVSAASSINSAAFNKFGKQAQTQRADEQNYYWNLVSAIALQTGQNFIDIDFDKVEKTISEIISVKERRFKRIFVKLAPGLAAHLARAYGPLGAAFVARCNAAAPLQQASTNASTNDGLPPLPPQKAEEEPQAWTGPTEQQTARTSDGKAAVNVLHGPGNLSRTAQSDASRSDFSVDEEGCRAAPLLLEPQFAGFDAVERLLGQLACYSEVACGGAETASRKTDQASGAPAEAEVIPEGGQAQAHYGAQFHAPNPLTAFRRVFSLPGVQKLFCQQAAPQPYQDFEKMPAQLRAFIRNLGGRTRMQQKISGLQAPPEAVQKGLAQIAINQAANILAGERGFAQFSRNWVLSGVVFGPILGDIFEYIKIQNSAATNSALARQRVIVSDQIPYKQVKILEDGFIDFGSSKDAAAAADKGQNAQKLPFYLTLRGFELNNIGYDAQQRTVCDLSEAMQKGFLQTPDLYACVCVVDSWQSGSYDPALGDTEHLHVCESYVPVPLRIGGYCRPVVLLGNKTGVSGREWVNRGAFFGVKEM